jgi:hypothetical protein
MYQYAYLTGAVISIVIWVALFIGRRDLRKQMLFMSFLTLLLAPTNILYFGAYWQPQFLFNFYNVGIESVIVCFSYGGVCGVIYEYVFHKKDVSKDIDRWSIDYLHPGIAFLCGVVAILVLEVFTGLNVIISTSTGLLVTAAMYVYFRPDLVKPIFLAGLLSTAVSMIVYWILLLPYPDFFNEFWVAGKITNTRFLLIPIEEYFFHFSLGACLGSMYESVFKKTYVDLDKSI